MNEGWRLELRSGVSALQGVVADADLPRLVRYLELLAEWNVAYNLTAVRDPAAMVARHVLDSLVVVPYLGGERVLDVGTGAGLPGIPLAIACPQRRFTLLDSNGKKTRFVTHAALTLGLANVEVVKSRVEDYRPPAPFDTVISRAFAALADFAAAAGRHLAPGGRLLAMKGAWPQDEMAALPADWRVSAVHPLAVPGLDAQRHLVVLERAGSQR